MRLTALAIQNHDFRSRFRGYDADEVDAFMKMVADDYELLARENESLKDAKMRLESRVEELGGAEKVLRQTLVSAQDMSEKLRQAAVRESETLLAEAEARAEKIVDASHRRVARLGEDIRELRGLRKRLATALRSNIDTHLGLIDTLEFDTPTVSYERIEDDDDEKPIAPVPGAPAVQRGSQPAAAVAVAAPKTPSNPQTATAGNAAPKAPVRRT